jgi:hypothetical protein
MRTSRIKLGEYLAKALRKKRKVAKNRRQI